ncbi:uncharacterized protein VICG_00170 [Vittaforma corneae ATCC 50505]|uniref:Uncharacterized protein n=1 Tax=Vittaforma corneae (strain ATCC 50505) TaxID=993615 RepID=L2GQR1_VITCO|nr:uncharacterized protein VICG_00170 [Vittaforma corneae ATCC 50505]ELA42855.1 hypothetical protein VICG_00170 [Vittaforma corneae ATCC 50505]
MAFIEKYYGIEESRKLVEKKLQHRSNKYLAKLEESQLLKEANSLFARGNTGQCFGILQKAVTLVPNDFRPYYLLGLIHEENGKHEKALVSYIAAAILKNNDISLWKKALNISLRTSSYRNQILALERIFRKEPSESILVKKLEILKQMKKKYAVVACQIELFDYQGVDPRIFEKFEHTNHINSLRKICSCLYKCIKHNKQARTEVFLRKTVFTLFKIKDWRRILRILDEYYFKENDKIHPDIRFIYMTAALYSKECRFDNLLDFSGLLNDAYTWREMENPEYIYSLAICLKECGEAKKSILLLEKYLSVSQTTKSLHILGDINQEVGNVQSAIQNFSQVLALDPVDELAKTRLHQIYESLGYNSLAEKFETPTRVVEYIKEIEATKKHEFRYSAEKCREMRKLYECILSISPSDYAEFLELSRPLVSDFFANPFVIVKNKNFKKFNSKNERLEFDDSNMLVAYDANISKKQLSDMLVRISSLHGLDIDEWFFVVKNTVTSLMVLEKYEDAVEIVRKCFDVHIFTHNDQIIQILLLGIRLYLMSGDFDGIHDIIREMIGHFGYTSVYFLYFLSYFFPDFYLCKNFSDLQKNIQKITRRSSREQCEVYEESKNWADSFNGKECICDASDHSADFCNKTTEIPPFLSVMSFIPRFLQTETVDFVLGNVASLKSEISIIKAVISISHTKSRTLVDKKKYASQGIACLKAMESDPVATYNLAKAYHFFGYYTHAELLYLRVIEAGPEELKRMSVFNLSLIFKDNKSRKVIENLLSKCKQW